jgi:hypothetical protein
MGPPSIVLNGNWGSFLVVKTPGCYISHSATPRAKVKNEWSYIPIPPIRLHGVDRQNFLLYIHHYYYIVYY